MHVALPYPFFIILYCLSISYGMSSNLGGGANTNQRRITGNVISLLNIEVLMYVINDIGVVKGWADAFTTLEACLL